MAPGVNTLLLNLPRRHVVSLSTPVTGRPISADILLINNLHSLLKVVSYRPFFTWPIFQNRKNSKPEIEESMYGPKAIFGCRFTGP